MTDNEIIKALECCHKAECMPCPLFKAGGNCDLTNKTIDLINRQKEEIERIKNAFENSQKTSKYWKSKCDELTEEVLTTKAEAIREFAEKLKESAFDVDVSFGYGKICYDKAVALIEIVNTVKEMECGTNEMQNTEAD